MKKHGYVLSSMHFLLLLQFDNKGTSGIPIQDCRMFFKCSRRYSNIQNWELSFCRELKRKTLFENVAEEVVFDGAKL